MADHQVTCCFRSSPSVIRRLLNRQLNCYIAPDTLNLFGKISFPTFPRCKVRLFAFLFHPAKVRPVDFGWNFIVQMQTIQDIYKANALTGWPVTRLFLQPKHSAD
jgi:hypothetical protein